MTPSADRRLSPALPLLALVALLLAGCGEPTIEPYDPRVVEARIPDVIEALRVGDPAAALKHIEGHVKDGESASGLEHYRGLALADLGRVDDALAAFQRELDRNPGNGRAHGMAADLLVEQGRLDEAQVHVDQSRRLASDFPYLLLVAGRLALLKDEDALATNAFQTYLTTDMTSARAAEAHYALSQLASRRGDSPAAEHHAEASEHLERIQQYLNLYLDRLAKDPADAPAALGVGMIHLDLFRSYGMDRRQLERAEAALQACLAIENRNVRALFNMGFVRTVQERNDEALELYGQVMLLDPGHVGARLNAGILARQMGRPADATRWLQEATGGAEGGERERVLYELAGAYEDQGLNELARETYRTFLDLPPRDPRDAAARLDALQG